MRHVKSWTRVLFVMTLLFPNMIQGAEVTQKIRVGLPSLALTYMPFYVAQEKGFLKKVGLEAEYIQMNTAIQPQALINGNINFFLRYRPEFRRRSPGCRWWSCSIFTTSRRGCS